MAQTVANLADVLKEAWTSDRLQKQFYDENPFLERVRQYEATAIGEEAHVPIHKTRSGGYTSTNAAGGSLNDADEQKVDRATYTLVYHWFQVQLETAALAQAQGGDTAVVVAKDLELQGAIADTKRQCSRQVVTNSDGVLAHCDVTSNSTSVELTVDSATAYGNQAIVRGWLYPGLTIDIGTTSDTDAASTGNTITAVTESTTDPKITVSSAVTTTTSDRIFVANPNSATAANPELNGLRSMVGSTTDALGGLDPDTAGEEFWKPAHVDSTTTALSLNLLLTMSRHVRQRSGKRHTYNLTGLKQEQAFYELLQNQVRFTEDKVSAGKSGSAVWNGMEVVALPDVLDTDWFMLTIEDFVRIVPKYLTKPTWVSDIEQAGGRLRWNQGTTNFKDAVVYPLQVGLQRRNTHAAAIGLTA